MAVFRIQCRRPYHLLLLSILNIACKWLQELCNGAREKSLFSVMMIGFMFTLASVLLKVYMIVIGQRDLQHASKSKIWPSPKNCLARNPILITLG